MTDIQPITELNTYKNNLIAQLTTEKKQIIAQLTTKKNQVTIQLNARYTPILRYIRYMKSSTSVKHDYTQYIRNKYYKSLKPIRDKYNLNVQSQNTNFQNELNKINLLTDIPGRRTPEKFSLIVGINYINTNYTLRGCINDANKIKQFIDAYAYKTNNIVLLTDETEDKPTKHNIIKSFKNLLQNSVSGDTLVFMYSGHGTYTADINGDELDGCDEMIIPIDATNPQSCIIDDEFKTIIDAYLKSGVKLFILMDCCFSGTILDLKYNYLDYDNLYNTTVNSKTNETNGQVIVFSGCTDKQTSIELQFNHGHTPTYGGALTLSFLQYISEKGDAISIQQLLEGMRQILTDNKCQQTIQISSGNLLDISKLMLTEVL